jgi:hypothetical protein
MMEDDQLKRIEKESKEGWHSGSEDVIAELIKEVRQLRGALLNLLPDGPMCLLSDYKAMRDERDAIIVDLKAQHRAALAEIEIWKGHYNHLGDRLNVVTDERNKHERRAAVINAIGAHMRQTVDAHRQQENQDDAIRAGIQPAPLDAPDARVNPDCTIRGVK